MLRFQESTPTKVQQEEIRSINNTDTLDTKISISQQLLLQKEKLLTQKIYNNINNANNNLDLRQKIFLRKMHKNNIIQLENNETNKAIYEILASVSIHSINHTKYAHSKQQLKNLYFALDYIERNNLLTTDFFNECFYLLINILFQHSTKTMIFKAVMKILIKYSKSYIIKMKYQKNENNDILYTYVFKQTLDTLHIEILCQLDQINGNINKSFKTLCKNLVNYINDITCDIIHGVDFNMHDFISISTILIIGQSNIIRCQKIKIAIQKLKNASFQRFNNIQLINNIPLMMNNIFP